MTSAQPSQPALARFGEPSTMGLLLSGGLDSAILLHQLLAHAGRFSRSTSAPAAFGKEEELDAVRRLLAASKQRDLNELVELELPVEDLYADHWSITGTSVPDRQSGDEAVFLPGRNPLLLLKPALWCVMHGIPKLALATLAANPFEDAKPDFFERFEAMIVQATGHEVKIVRPFEILSKRCVMQLGRDVPLELTFSCLAPVGRLHCGRCNKCAERAAAFAHLNSGDPTPYAENVA